MTTLLSESFTGSNGSALSANWTTGYTGTGAATAIQGNKGRWTTGTAGGYAGTARISRRAVITSPTNVEITGTYTPQGESYPEIYVRSSDTVFDTQNGYALRLPTQGGESGIKVIKYVSYTGTDLASSAFSASNGVTYGFRFQVIGTAIKARIWNTSGAEPSTWGIQVTDSAISSAGNVGISIGAGNAASTYVDFDDFVITDGVTSVAGAETLTLTDAASVAASLTGAETLSWAENAVVLQEYSGTGESLSWSESASLEVFRLYHDVKTEIEFTTGTWTDVSAYLEADTESVGTFGRTTRYDDVAASTWDLTLRNSDGRFTPGNPNSPYYPNVAKGKNVRVSITYAGQSYSRFWGQISAISMPALTSVEDATIRVQCADVMAPLDRKTLLSPFVEESRRVARQSSGGGVDVFPFPSSSVKSDGSVQVADTSFENKGFLAPSSTRLGSISIMASGNGAGQVKSSGADSDGGVLSEGQLDFEIGDNGFGKQAHPIIVAKPQVGFQQFELFFKIPEGVLPPIYKTGTYTVPSDGDGWNTIRDTYGLTFTQLRELNPDLGGLPALAVGQVVNIATSTDDSEWILADFWVGSTEILRIVLGNYQDRVVMAAKKPSGGASYVSGLDTNLADGKWHKLTIYKDDSNTVRCNINDSPAGTAISSMAGDLASVDTVYITGRHNPSSGSGQQVQCPPCSIGGLAFQRTRVGVWYWYALGAPPANVTARERFLELAQYANPIQVNTGVAWHSSLDRPFDVKIVRTNITGRTVLDCMQELARTVGAYLWVQPEDGVLTMRKGPTPPTALADIDMVADIDIENPPQWRDSVDVNPTRVTAKCPAGEVTSINTAAESAGQYKDTVVETCAATVAVARGVADRYVTNQATLRLSNVQVDLVHSEGPLYSLLLPPLLPTERVLHVTSVPSAVLGFDTVDATVESWTESYTVDTAKFVFETTPIATYTTTPPLAGFTVTSSTGTQSGADVAVPQPQGTASSDLLLAIMTVDDTGSVAGMTPPDSSWTAQGSGGSADSGYGQVWTKTAGATEPTTYTFSATGSAGSAVLVQDDFTGTNGTGLDSAKWNAAETRTGAATTIQDNTGLLNPGTGTGYTGRVSVVADMTDKADVELAVSFKFLDGDSFFWCMLRSTSASTPDQYGYEIRPDVTSDSVRVASVNNYSVTTLGTIPLTMNPSTWYRLRFQVVGSAVRARVWPLASAEPSAWAVDTTSTAFTAAGKVALVAGGGSTAAARINIDDVVISDPHAITSIPEAKVTLLRVAGADTTSPILVAPSWSANNSATTDHSAPSISPASSGLLVNHWHTLTEGAGSGGGSGGGSTAFAFGMSGFDNAAQIDAANAWLTNNSLRAVGFWADSNATVQQEQWGLGTGETFANWTGIVDLAFGGIFGSETWAQAAAGNFDTRWQTGLDAIATKWGSRPPGNLHIRFAHEFNGDFSDWAVTNSGDNSYTNFKTAWIRWANKVRATLPGVQIVWSPNDGTSSLTSVDNAYPGSSYVDVIGPDTYNAWPHVSTLAEWTSKINTTDGNGNPVGIEKWRQYALAKGKPLCIPEWGNRVNNVDGGGGGDHPVFAERMLAWCKENGGFGPGQVKYAVYFNFGTAGGYPPDYLIWASGTNGTVNQPLTAATIRSNA